MRSLFGSISYRCNGCNRPMDYEDIDLRLTDGNVEKRLVGKQHFCEKCAPVAKRTYLVKEEHA